MCLYWCFAFSCYVLSLTAVILKSYSQSQDSLGLKTSLNAFIFYKKVPFLNSLLMKMTLIVFQDDQRSVSFLSSDSKPRGGNKTAGSQCNV